MVAGAIGRVQLCGQFAIIASGSRIDASLPGRRGRLLVAYLAGHRRQPCSRDKLIDALWPEGATDAAAATLTVLLARSSTSRWQLPACIRQSQLWRWENGDEPGAQHLPRSSPPDAPTSPVTTLRGSTTNVLAST